ncbi:LuxR C-terminal-related transcriptional regulator [Fluviibacterium sp. DFM31]|uniref:LuxR C-terminal-related transcriptional regulator n=2 Tax=Meridianimarinicoccus marinus TaxID=3231483 RepID=A0ABV3L361_9RHOB
MTLASRASHPQTGHTAEDAAIIAAIREETLAFLAQDHDRWARCWVHSPRTRDIYGSPFAGLNVLSGWSDICANMKRVFEDGLACQKTDFRQDGHRISVEGNIAWAVFDGWALTRNGETEETFETRILERQPEGWKIVYSSVYLRRDNGARSALSVAVDGTGQIVWACDRALKVLKTHPYFTVSSGKVRAHRLDWDRTLQQAFTRAAAYHGFFEVYRFAEENGGPVCFPAVLGQTDEGGVAVARLSVRDSTTYLQLDGDADLDRRLTVAQAVFGLSDGQLRVARHIADGDSLPEVATALGISINTARTHLSRLYEKTGVNAQTALVRLLLSVG